MRAAPILSVLILLVAGPLASGHAHAKLYKWVDDEGNVTYSQQKPPDKPADEVRLHGVQAPDPAAQQDLEAAQDQADAQRKDREFKTSYDAETKDRDARIKENCEIARQNLRVLSNASRVQDKDADGNPYFLDDAARQARIEKSNKQVEEYCP